MSEALSVSTISIQNCGENLMSIAENLLYKDANIAICKISVEDLKNENFDNIEKLAYFEYGDWDNLSTYVSKELQRIKEQFEEDLQERLDDEEISETCFGIFSCFLYCNDNMNDEIVTILSIRTLFGVQQINELHI